jgi:hypothetical protein
MSSDASLFTVVGALTPVVFALLLVAVDAIYPCDCEALVFVKPVNALQFAASAYAVSAHQSV